MLAKLAADSKLPVCTVQSTWDRSGKHAAQLGKIGKQTTNLHRLHVTWH